MWWIGLSTDVHKMGSPSISHWTFGVWRRAVKVKVKVEKGQGRAVMDELAAGEISTDSSRGGGEGRPLGSCNCGRGMIWDSHTQTPFASAPVSDTALLLKR